MDFDNPTFLRSGWTAGKTAPGARIAVFAGRSNAGKSSVLNALCGGRFARAAKTPGRTRMINLFQLRGGHLLADLPGYGYAKTPQSTQTLWRKNIARFLQNPKIGCVVLVADARRGLGENDFALLQLVRHSPALVLLNKADKLNRAEIRQQTQNTLAQLGGESAKNAVIPFSATHKTGAGETRKNLAKLMNPPANSQ